jgi:hypothetical protein
VGAVSTTTTAPVEDPVRQWRVLNTTTVMNNVDYGLVNLRRLALYRESQLGYVFQDGYTPPPLNLFLDDVDLEYYGWTGTSGGYFQFKRSTLAVGRRLPVSDAVPLALYNTKAQKYLVGLKWSKTPAFEWRVQRRNGADFALFNVNARAYLVLDESNQERLVFKSQ